SLARDKSRAAQFPGLRVLSAGDGDGFVHGRLGLVRRAGASEQPGRPTREWSGRLAQTRGLDRQDYVQHGRGRPSVGETPANTVDVFLASAAPLARDSGCPPNRVNPNLWQPPAPGGALARGDCGWPPARPAADEKARAVGGEAE